MTPNFSGMWKANLAKSRILSGAPRGIFARIAHQGSDMSMEVIAMKQDGSEDRAVFTCLTTGEDGSSSMNGNALRGKAAWDGEELIIESWVKIRDQDVYLRDCWSLAGDGTLVMEHREDALAGQISVLERVESEEGYVTVDEGVRLFHKRLGSGGKTVLIPNGFHLFKDFEMLARDHTLICYDVRNRGLSDTATDPAKLMRGVENDADDIEAVRRHFGIDRVSIIGHSYIGLTAILYAMRYPGGVERIVQIGAPSPHAGKQYPPELSWNDSVMAQVFTKLGEMQKARKPEDDPVEFCRRFWETLREIFVADPANVKRIDWGRCELANERNFMEHFAQVIAPSIARLKFGPEEVANVTIPVLTIHGRKDRSAPYGAAQDWVALLPNARLVTVDSAAHAPWIEAPDLVFGAIEDFLNH